MIVKDWVIAAAREIADYVLPTGVADEQRHAITKNFTTMIRKHCPFKNDTAYMEVPRCVTCQHWDKDVVEKDQGKCGKVYDSDDTKIWPDLYDGINTMADFGCTQWEAK